jgi:hypothetical protein
VPAKAAYLALQERPDLEFEHYLAVKLSMTVQELRDRMTHAEFLRWDMYYARLAQQQELEQLKAKG